MDQLQNAALQEAQGMVPHLPGIQEYKPRDLSSLYKLSSIDKPFVSSRYWAQVPFHMSQKDLFQHGQNNNIWIKNRLEESN